MSEITDGVNAVNLVHYKFIFVLWQNWKLEESWKTQGKGFEATPNQRSLGCLPFLWTFSLDYHVFAIVLFSACTLCIHCFFRRLFSLLTFLEGIILRMCTHYAHVGLPQLTSCHCWYLFQETWPQSAVPPSCYLFGGDNEKSWRELEKQNWA